MKRIVKVIIFKEATTSLLYFTYRRYLTLAWLLKNEIQIQAMQVAIPSNSWQGKKSYYASRTYQNFLETQDRNRESHNLGTLNDVISVQKYSIFPQVFFDPSILKKQLPAALALPYRSPTSSAAFSPSSPTYPTHEFTFLSLKVLIFASHAKGININYMKSNFHNCNHRRRNYSG